MIFGKFARNIGISFLKQETISLKKVLSVRLLWFVSSMLFQRLCPRVDFVWFSQEDSHSYEDIPWETSNEISEL